MQITGIADGVLSDRQMGMMIETGQITSEWDIEEGQVQPASLDLRLGAKAYRVRASFLPGRSATVSDRLNEFTMHEMDLRAGAVLEKGCVYVVPLLEALNFDHPTREGEKTSWRFRPAAGGSLVLTASGDVREGNSRRVKRSRGKIHRR